MRAIIWLGVALRGELEQRCDLVRLGYVRAREFLRKGFSSEIPIRIGNVPSSRKGNVPNSNADTRDLGDT